MVLGGTILEGASRLCMNEISDQPEYVRDQFRIGPPSRDAIEAIARIVENLKAAGVSPIAAAGALGLMAASRTLTEPLLRSVVAAAERYERLAGLAREQA